MASKTVADDMRAMFGKVTRWKTPDGILWTENDMLRMAYVVFDPTTDEMKPFGLAVRNDTFVGLITAEQAKLWDGCECRPSN